MIKALKRFLIASFIVIVLLIVIPFFIPLDDYKPDVEAQLSKAVGRSVILSSLRLQILPVPALTAKGIGIFGAGETSGEVFVNRLEITPLFHKLLDKELVIRRIHLEGVATNQAFLQSYLTQPRQQASDDQARVSIEEISASAVTLRLHDNTLLGPYQFKIFFGADQQPTLFNVSRMDGSANVNISPYEDGYRIYAKARDWTFPVRTPFHFDNIVATGQLDNNKLHIPNINAKAYGGTLQGPVTVSWDQAWNISGQLNAKSIAMEPFLKVLKGKGIRGNFNADLSFDLKAPEFRKLLSNPYLDGEFRITDGIVSKLNPANPVFVFDEFTGHGTLDNAQFTAHNAVLKTYGGTFSGSPAISWKQGWIVTGQLEAESIGIKPFLDVLGGRGVAGNFNSNARVVLEAPTFKQLLAKPYIDGEFKVTDGVITNTDPARPVFVFDEFSGHGTLDTKQFSTQNALLKAYGGIFKGNPQISWARDWTAGGEIAAESIDLERLLAGFNDKKTISGSFTGQGKVDLAGTRFIDLDNNPYMEGQFRLKEGVFYKADLEKASTTLTKAGTTGGQTPFKELNGTALIKNGHITLSKLDITSSALEAKGRIHIDSNKNIEGKMDVGLRKTASLISIPLIVDGTTEIPHLRPTNSAVIGGAVGTGMLGPGLGTAIGIKVGKILNQIGSAMTGNKADDTADGNDSDTSINAD